MNDKAKNFVAALDKMTGDYIDLFLVIPSSAAESLAGQLGTAWLSINLTDNQVFAAHCLPAPTARTLMKDESIASGFVGDSWESVVASEHPALKYVLDVQVEQTCLDGSREQTRVRLSEVQSGWHTRGFYVPGVRGGQTAPTVALGPFSSWTPLPPERDGTAEQVDESDVHLFFFSNYGVDLSGASHLDLGNGVTWWTADYFPCSEQCYRAFSSHESMVHGCRPLTGVLAVPQSGDVGDHRTHMADFNRALQLINRLRVLLNILDDGVPYIIAYSSIRGIGQGSSGTRNVLTGIEYRHRTSENWVRQKCYPSETLKRAASIAFSKPQGKKTILTHIQRAADSLDLSRSVHDPNIALVLGWVALESILSPVDHSELITNMTLSMIGLADESMDFNSLWDTAKRSYKVRSNIVHSFDVPDAQELTAAHNFAQDQCVRAILAALDAFGDGRSRPELLKLLRQKALRKPARQD